MEPSPGCFPVTEAVELHRKPDLKDLYLAVSHLNMGARVAEPAPASVSAILVKQESPDVAVAAGRMTYLDSVCDSSSSPGRPAPCPAPAARDSAVMPPPPPPRPTSRESHLMPPPSLVPVPSPAGKQGAEGGAGSRPRSASYQDHHKETIGRQHCLKQS